MNLQGDAMTAPRETLYQETKRPLFHFTARYWNNYSLNPGRHCEGWMNDMNGLVYNAGEYHLFAQRWWSAWLHATSTDLIHWKELKPAFGEGGRFGGTQSGGCVVDHKNSSGLGDGETPPMIAFWSSTDNLNQCISYSLDRGATWKKYENNPVLVHAHRDPNVFWYEPDGKWVMILYGTDETGEELAEHMIYNVFKSDNLLEWTKLDTNIPGYECPDMFPLLVDGERGQQKWIVIDGRGDYIVGQFDGKSFAAEDTKKRGDYGRNFYATMTFDNMPKSDGRRIQMAWMRGDDYPDDMPFNQQASFPCELSLRRLTEGLVLCRYPVREIERLCAATFELTAHSLREHENPLSSIEGECFDIEAKIDVAGSTCDEIIFSLRGNTVKYDVRNESLDSHGTVVPLEPRSGSIALRILIDRLSIETFGNNGEVSITNISHHNEETPRLSLRAIGGAAHLTSLTVRTLRSMWV
jgi:fructan beta-fructosidase